MAALLLSVIRSPFRCIDAKTYVRVAYRHLAGEPVEFSGRVRGHVDRPVSASSNCATHRRQTARSSFGRPATR